VSTSNVHGDQTTLHRHDIAWVSRQHAERFADPIAAPRLRLLLREWIAAGRPFVVCRQAERWGRDALTLGLPLPPAAEKRRISLEFPNDAIDRISPPPALGDVAAYGPAHWRPALSLLHALAEEIGIGFRVFGSAAWQMLTGLPYLSVRSDLDLLWRPRDQVQLASGLDLLERWERDTGIRADGEILFADQAVAWREWHRRGAVSRVVVKELRGVALRTPAELLQMLPDAGLSCPNLGACA
jgi:phosphoribosyl-dephospho-CoA transferase